MFLLWMTWSLCWLTRWMFEELEKSRLEKNVKVWDGKHCVWSNTHAELLQHGYTTVFPLSRCPSTPLLCCLAIIKCLILVKPGCCWPAVWFCWPWETPGNSQLSSTDRWTAGASWGWDQPAAGREYIFGYVCVFWVCVCKHHGGTKKTFNCKALVEEHSFWILA